MIEASTLAKAGGPIRSPTGPQMLKPVAENRGTNTWPGCPRSSLYVIIPDRKAPKGKNIVATIGLGVSVEARRPSGSTRQL